jgi:small subunit ribosomal protein S6
MFEEPCGTKQVRLHYVPFRSRQAYGLNWSNPMERRSILMRKYELVCIVQPELDETAFKGVVDRVSGWVTDAGGSVDKVDIWGRRRLAYQIRKQREGQYVLMNVTLDPKSTSELERNIRYLETVLRHMLSAV